MDLIEKHLRLPRNNLVLLQFILEGYGRMFMVSTLEPRSALVKLYIQPSYYREGMNILEALKDELELMWMPV